MTVIPRHRVDRAVREQLASLTGKETFLVKVDQDTPELPYAVIEPLLRSEGYGAWADPEECRDFVYQVRSVGEDPRQCAWMSSQVEQFFVGRKSSGDYDTEIPIDGAYVAWRSSEVQGTILPVGDVLYEVADRYRLRVERQN